MNCLILGAGPAGLTAANSLKARGIDFLVLEKDAAAGGLCKSAQVDGTPLDIGGGHFLDVRNPDVLGFLFQFMPESEWSRYQRNSKIKLRGITMDYPMESNIWQMDVDAQVAYLESIVRAGCNTGAAMPESFVEWITWKLGDRIAEEYMLPYNRKMFGSHITDLGTYWLNKLPNVSFRDTLYSCLTRKPYGSLPGHAEFFYPKRFGYGELWTRMADAVKPNILFDTAVTGIDFNTRTVTAADGRPYTADLIITTIPWASFQSIQGAPEAVVRGIQSLRHTSVDVEYYPETLDTQAHWVYEPDPDLPYHRILVRHNFTANGKGYWTETNHDRAGLPHNPGSYTYTNEYAYPLNTVSKPGVMQEMLRFARAKQTIGLGRWGEHEHFNSDVTVARALDLVNSL